MHSINLICKITNTLLEFVEFEFHTLGFGKKILTFTFTTNTQFNSIQNLIKTYLKSIFVEVDTERVQCNVMSKSLDS